MREERSSDFESRYDKCRKDVIWIGPSRENPPSEAAAKKFLQLCQRPMDQRHRDRSLAHRLCNALDAICAHIADRENSRQAGFEHLWASIERPSELF